VPAWIRSPGKWCSISSAELRNSGMGIILTTHLMDDAQRLADYVYIIDAGRNVAEGTVGELLRRTA
jgi:ABC-2 type transport system ATP-binding protein